MTDKAARRALMIAKHPLTQDVYHGTQHVFDKFKDHSGRQVSLSLGTHVARDPAISSNEYFTNRDGEHGGHVLPLKTYPDEKFYEIPQGKPHGGLIFDDIAVENAVKHHAFKKHPHMLAASLQMYHGLEDNPHEAIRGAEALSQDKPWKSPLGGQYNNLHELVTDPIYSPNFASQEAHTAAVKSFRDHLIKQGYAGVKYINTSDDETEGAKTKVNYIVFNKPTSEGYYPLRGRFAAFDPAHKADPDLMKSEGGEIEPLKAAGYWQDNPAVSRGAHDWLKGKQEFAESDPKLLRGVTTAGTEAVNIPVDMLKGVPGAMDENPVPGTPKYDRLMKEVKKNGWRNDSPILVGVNHKGKPFILEGNHRSAVARAIGQTHIPGEIKWWNGGEEVEGDWHPKRIAPRLKKYERASGGKVPPFKLHSGAAKLIAAKGQAKATPQQYAALPGIKPDELKHAKFTDLPAKAQPREEVIKHLEANTVPLQETVLGEPDFKALARRYIEEDERRVHENFHDTHGRNPRSYDEALQHAERMARYDNISEELQAGTHKYKDYTLPGGENYREVLLHLPSDVDKRLDALHERGDINADPALGAEYERLMKERGNQYKSSHWDVPNVVAHLRMSDRKGPSGEKVLHVEELQSDWGQQGREKGFKTGADERYDNWKADALKRAEQKLAQETMPDPTKKVFMQAFNDLSSGHNPLALYLGEKEHADKLWQDKLKEQQATPHGPYVDNTQKWTDLALKRVLHEAAHGGYDKVVFTPGAEQNKRYSLESHIKHLDYHPEAEYLHATTHEGRGIEHENVKPGDLAGIVGKDVADRLLKQPLEGEGDENVNLGPRHRLSDKGLVMGGSGMRGYYDNILPKRLQALAQQHDPKAKVALNGFQHGKPTKLTLKAWTSDPEGPHSVYDGSRRIAQFNTRAEAEEFAQKAEPEASSPATSGMLHSLDVTPQMRDSIKANGFSQFKRGGTVEGGPIADWHWRPVEDVRNELQLNEIPSHVHKFGEFMDETARRASSQGLTPRDLIKAYAITRASIGRRALPVETLRQTFSELPKGLKGRVRPEGAMGHWLHTKMGQRYLDEAEAGRVDEEAIAHAQNAMRRFGKVETEPTALRWAAKNLPGMEGRVSELIARAHRGQSSPDEWRNEMRVPGVAASKAGFLASMLGRGDQPTLDARQIILHTGRPTKEAAPILGRAGAANAAVDRLADRQTQLGFKHDKSMSPFYQHLAHHAIWDKTAGEETTHDDLMQALRGAKDGGRQELKKGGKAEDLGLIGSHPVMRALIEGLPHEAFLPTKHAEMNDLLRKAGVVRPYDDSKANVEKALKIAQDNYQLHAGVGSGKDPSSYYNIRQPVAARDVSTKIAALRGRTPKPQVDMSWEKFGKIGEGGTAINLAGDRTRIGTLGEINGKKLNWPVHLYGGPEYIREGKKGIVWANNAGVATGLRNTIRKLSQRGPVYGVYSPMSAVSGDQAHHMFDAVMAQIDPGSISKKDRKAFDDAMRSGAFIMGNTEQVLKDRARVAEKMKSWPGIDNPKEASKFALEKLAGVDRKAIIQYLDKKMWSDRGFPHIGMTRAAITDPSVRDVHDNTIGGHVALLHPDQPDRQVSGNPTYPEGIAGEYVGTLPFVQKHYAAPVSTSHLVTTPTAGKGKLSHPFSTDDKARSSYRKLYEQNLIPEPIDQRMVDSASEGLEKQKLYGLKKGGVVDRALALTRKVK